MDGVELFEKEVEERNKVEKNIIGLFLSNRREIYLLGSV